MMWFLVPLLAGFALGGASAFTTAWSLRWGERGGQRATMLLRAASVPLWSMGYLLAVMTPEPRLFADSVVVAATGWLLVAIGGALILWAVGMLRRRATAPSISDAIEVRGPYAYIRHPVYAGMILELAGVFVLVPRVSVALACALGFLWLLVQARLEERDLLQRAPGYRTYMNNVPGFMPHG